MSMNKKFVEMLDETVMASFKELNRPSPVKTEVNHEIEDIRNT